jgi:hypothetical protein
MKPGGLDFSLKARGSTREEDETPLARDEAYEMEEQPYLTSPTARRKLRDPNLTTRAQSPKLRPIQNTSTQEIQQPQGMEPPITVNKSENLITKTFTKPIEPVIPKEEKLISSFLVSITGQIESCEVSVEFLMLISEVY